MPTIKIPPGVVRAETKNVVPGRWHVANLIRWQSGTMIPIGGYDRITQEPLGSIPRQIYTWLDEDGARHMAVLADDKLLVQVDDDFVDRTPAGFADANTSSERGYGAGDYGVADYGMDDEPRGVGPSLFDPKITVKFSMDNWASELVFSSSVDGRIFIYDPVADTIPVVAENAPEFVSCVVVTEERHMMAFGAQGKPNRVSWSDRENRAGWDFTNVTGQAGFYDLEGAGRIISAHKVPGAVLIFTSTSVWIGRYVGAPYYYGFTKIAEGCAPISAQAVAVAGGRAFWMGEKSFWKYEGGIVTTLTHTLGTGLFDNLDIAAPRRVCAGFNGLFPEIWFFYPSPQGLSPTITENDRYVIFGFETGQEWWADGVLSRSCFVWSPIDKFPIGGTDQTQIYRHEQGWLGEGLSRAGQVYAEVSSLSFDQGESVWTVQQCQIDNATGLASVEFDFKGSYVRGGPEYTFHQGLRGRDDGYLDTHFKARDFSMTVRGVQDKPWGLGAMIFHKLKKGGAK